MSYLLCEVFWMDIMEQSWHMNTLVPETYTLGRLGDKDTSARGIMVRAMEDIFAEISLETDSICHIYR